MRERILVVDDEESIRFTFQSFLEEAGYGVSTAGSYDEAMAQLTAINFDVVFADILLGKTGIDLLQVIRTQGLLCPVVMITGAPDIESAAEAVRLGAFDYIAKPIRQETLLHVARKALQHKGLQEEKEKYRSNLEAIFRSVKDGIVTVDQDLLVVEVNEAAEKICGFSRGQLVGSPFGSIPNLCNAKCFEILEETIQKGESMELNRLECRRKGRLEQVVTISASPLVDHQGGFTGAVLVIRDETRLDDLERDLRERRQFHNIIGGNEQMQQIYSLIEDLAGVQTTVLVTGESGTGKELVAEALHYRGSRSKKPLVKVNCSALPENLLESELFGHVKGAFTGAIRDKVGRFQRANGGTILLDEIGDVSPRMQLRLLRVLQEMEFEPVGQSTPVKVDVRVVAATNQKLYEKVRRGEFREDLYYRLRVVEITMPPLRERRDDIPLLIDHFLKKFNHKFGRRVESVSEEVQEIFMEYPWQGNIRELEHAMEHAFILCHGRTLTVDQLPSNFRDFFRDKSVPEKKTTLGGPEAILEALEKSAGNKALAARLLGISRRTLYRKLEEYEIK